MKLLLISHKINISEHIQKVKIINRYIYQKSLNKNPK